MFYPLTPKARMQDFWRRCLSLGEAPGPRPAPCSTGIPALDKVLAGGLATGRIALIQGSDSCGKSEVCLTLAAHAQSTGHQVAWLDIDHTFCKARARAAGLHADALVAPCDDPVHALALARALLRGRHVSFVVLDPWPPAPAEDVPWRVLCPVARCVAEVEAVMVVAQGEPAGQGARYDAMRYASSTVMHLSPSAPGARGRAGVRVTVRKQPGRKPRETAPQITL